jgi:predicted transcriptional regulator
LSAAVAARGRVIDALVTCPTVHRPTTTIAELREFFRDEHVHMALLVGDGKLVGTVERADLTWRLGDDRLAATIARLAGRTVGPEADLQETFGAMTRAGRRRLAVTNVDSELVGLLCLKASGHGFCSDAGVGSRSRMGRQTQRGSAPCASS